MFSSLKQLAKAWMWKRFSMTSIALVCLCSFFLFIQYTSEYSRVYGSNYVFTKTVDVNMNDAEVSNGNTTSIYSRLKEKEPHSVAPPKWTYKCENHACIRILVEDGGEDTVTPFEVCWLTCGSHGPLWPYPSKLISKTSETVKFIPANLRLNNVETGCETVRNLTNQAFELKKMYFEQYPGLKDRDQGGFFSFFSQDTTFGYTIAVTIKVTKPYDIFKVGQTDESYVIKIEDGLDPASQTLSVSIEGTTFYGVRHGIETFSQLVGLDSVEKCLRVVKKFHASDAPAFPYRGILIDSARNFLPLEHIRRVIDAMSYNKLNILHWHLTDSNTFPFHSKRVPQMTQYGALPDQIYYPEEISELVRYARIRGVKIIPELDIPSHAGNGWQFGEKYGLGKLAFYINEYGDSWPQLCGQPPCGILNPININTYNILEEIFADMLDVFDNDVFHMGGDEVNLESWSRVPELRKWLKGKDGMDLWKFFQEEAFKRLRSRSANVTAILWVRVTVDSAWLCGGKDNIMLSELITRFLRAENYIIQVWESMTSQQVRGLLKKGFQLILSFVDVLYLDWGCGTWLGRNHDWKYHNWQKLYDVKVDAQSNKNQILGGEATLWGEKGGSDSLEIRIWPRASALAERLWSNPQKRDGSVYTRLNYLSYRMRKRGIPVGLLQPESCLHFKGHCRNPSDEL